MFRKFEKKLYPVDIAIQLSCNRPLLYKTRLAYQAVRKKILKKENETFLHQTFLQLPIELEI